MSKKIIANLFGYAAQEGAQGLVIETVNGKITFRYRFPGGEERSLVLPAKLKADLESTLYRLLKLAPDELALKKYCQLADSPLSLSCYLTITPTAQGEKIIITLVEKEKTNHSLRQLGLQPTKRRQLLTALKRKSGLIMITSPDNEGKSTTLCACLNELNQPEKSLYYLGKDQLTSVPGISSLPATLNNWHKVLKLDSDIIATEITTTEDLKQAVLAASTGRLIIATISANSVWTFLLDYLKLDLPLKLKLDSLKLILNQRILSLKRKTSRKSPRQKIGIFELLTMTEDLKRFILSASKNKKKENFWERLAAIALKNGYRPLASDREQKIKDGLISRT